MKVITREVLTTHMETYQLELTEEYVRSVNEYLQGRCTEVLPPITAEDIIASINYEEGDLFLNHEYTWKYWDSGTFQAVLKNMINETVNDDIWNRPFDDEYIETNDISDYVEEVDDEN